MTNLLKANANQLDEFIRENLSKNITFKFEKDEMIILIENLTTNGLKMIVKMHKNALNQTTNETITWQYLADPKDKNTAVTRKCSIASLGTNFVDIVENFRFDKTYLQELDKTAQ